MPVALTVRAVNTATDSENRIHDDRVASEYGFSGGLVPGVTIYGYLASAVIEHFGSPWLPSGAMDVRFFQPYYEGEEVAISVTAENGCAKVQAGSRSTGTAWLLTAPPADALPPETRAADRVTPSRDNVHPGVLLRTLEKTLDLSQPGLSAPLAAFVSEQRLAHPAIVLGLANELLMNHYLLGPWIHSSSEVRNARALRDRESVQVRGQLLDAYERKGHHFLVADVAILTGSLLATRIRHTAIWQPRKV